jgi:hypothetical protein
MMVAAPASDGAAAVSPRKRLAAAILLLVTRHAGGKDRVARHQRAGWVSGSPCRPESVDRVGAGDEGEDRIGAVRSRAFACCEGG